MREPDLLPITVRVLMLRTEPTTVAEPRKARSEAKRLRRRKPHEVLAWDTETAGTAEQPLNILVWRFCRDALGLQSSLTCIEEGIAYADDLPTRDPEGFTRLQRYVASHRADVAPGFPARLRFMPASEWAEERLYRYGYRHRDRCAIVGFNVFFDLGAIARSWAPAGGYYRGGWSLGIWGDVDDQGKWHDRRYHPRLLIKSIDPRRALFGWGSLKPGDDDAIASPGNVVDLRQLAFALTDKGFRLESACEAFGVPFVKGDVDYGVLDERMFDYARADVRATVDLYRACLAEVVLHEGVALRPGRLYSPATVGTEYLRAMGVRQPFAAFTDFEPGELGWTPR